MKRTLTFVALLALALPSPARADDTEAVAKYKQAVKLWNDPDPMKAVKVAEQALEAAESKKIRLNVLLLLGRLHSAKTGDTKAATKHYEELVASINSVSARDKGFLGLKSDALLSLGNMALAEEDDREKAEGLWQRSYEAKATPGNAEVLSLHHFNESFGAEGEKGKRVRLEKALTYAKEAVHLVERARPRNHAYVAKVQLQKVLVLTALERTEEADEAWAAIHQPSLDATASYQLAQLRALQGQDAEALAKLLQDAMKVRPTPATRNDLRKWIRQDPVFKPFLEHEAWKELVTDEGEPG
jgi:tetratricopeptide (TPR) repeat protein